jgi:hypothetical protein
VKSGLESGGGDRRCLEVVHLILCHAFLGEDISPLYSL